MCSNTRIATLRSRKWTPIEILSITWESLFCYHIWPWMTFSVGLLKLSRQRVSQRDKEREKTKQARKMTTYDTNSVRSTMLLNLFGCRIVDCIMRDHSNSRCRLTIVSYSFIVYFIFHLIIHRKYIEWIYL